MFFIERWQFVFHTAAGLIHLAQIEQEQRGVAVQELQRHAVFLFGGKILHRAFAEGPRQRAFLQAYGDDVLLGEDDAERQRGIHKAAALLGLDGRAYPPASSIWPSSKSMRLRSSSSSAARTRSGIDATAWSHTGCHFFLGGRAQIAPTRRASMLLQLAQLAIVGKINRNHTISLLSARRNAQHAEHQKTARSAESAVQFLSGMIALEDRPPRTVTPFLCQLLRFRRRKSPRASKDSSVHEVPAEQELYYY